MERLLSRAGAWLLVPALLASVSYQLAYEWFYLTEVSALFWALFTFVVVIPLHIFDEARFAENQELLEPSLTDSLIYPAVLLCRYAGAALVGFLCFEGLPLPWPHRFAAAILAAVVSLAILWGALSQRPAFISGRRLITVRAAQKRANRYREKRGSSAFVPRATDPSIPFGGIELPPEGNKYHYFIIGAARSGKSVQIFLILERVVSRLGKGFGERVIVFDSKCEMPALLAGMKPKIPVWCLLPVDQPSDSGAPSPIVRCVAWNIAGKFDGLSDLEARCLALELAACFSQGRPDKDDFFAKGATDIISGAIIALRYKLGSDWSLFTLATILSNPLDMITLLGSCPDTTDRLVYFDEHTRSSADLIKTLRVEFAELALVALAWTNSPHKMTLREFVRSEGILVLSVHQSYRTSLTALYRAVMSRFLALSLRPDAEKNGLSWAFLDEARLLYRLDSIENTILQAGSKRLALVVGYQSDSGWRAVYGDNVSRETAAQLANFIALRSEEHESAEYASRRLGQIEHWTRARNGFFGSTHGPWQRSDRALVKEGPIQNLPAANFERNGIQGFATSPVVGDAWRFTLSGRFLRENVPKPDPSVPNVVPRSQDEVLPLGLPLEVRECLGLGEIGKAESEEADEPKEVSRNGHGGRKKKTEITDPAKGAIEKAREAFHEMSRQWQLEDQG